jgi:hypothetical protein
VAGLVVGRSVVRLRSAVAAAEEADATARSGVEASMPSSSGSVDGVTARATATVAKTLVAAMTTSTGTALTSCRMTIDAAMTSSTVVSTMSEPIMRSRIVGPRTMRPTASVRVAPSNARTRAMPIDMTTTAALTGSPRAAARTVRTRPASTRSHG